MSEAATSDARVAGRAASAGRLRVELATSSLLPPLPEAFLGGDALDLLDPLVFVPPAELAAVEHGEVAWLAPPRLSAEQVASRRELAAALASANIAYGNPRADELARRLADPEAVVVVAGQQPGVLGGPLYTFSKLLAVSRLAAAVEAAGRPAVPVFWVATEDHDWQEVSRATVLTSRGTLDLDLGDDPQPLAPAGTRTFGPGIERLLAELAEAMPGERYGEWLAEVGRWYRPDARFGEAFCRLMAALAGEHTPLLLDAMLPGVKAAQRPWLQRLVERRDEVEAAYAAADERIAGRGFPLQVSPQRGASPLFLLSRGERRRIAWSGDGFELRGRDEAPRPVAELLAAIAENPLAVSPGVLARPAVQDAILGTALQLLGPGELSYFPQVAPVYPVLGIEPSRLALRPQVLVLEEHQVGKLEEVDLTLAELLARRELLERVLAEKGGGDLTADARRRVEEALAALEEPALSLDANLERPLAKTRSQVLGALDTFAGKVRSAAARGDEVRSGRVERLRDTVLPHGKLQERVVATAHYPGKYGPRFAESYWRQMSLDGGVLQVVIP